MEYLSSTDFSSNPPSGQKAPYLLEVTSGGCGVKDRQLELLVRADDPHGPRISGKALAAKAITWLDF